MSAAERVAHAAETIRARWERDITTDPQTEAAQALEDSCQLLDPEVAAELERLRELLREATAGAAVADDLTAEWRKRAEAAEARVAELEAQRERRRVRLVALQNDALSMRGSLSPMGEGRKVPFPLGETLTPAVDWLIARVAELEAMQGTAFRASHDSIVMGLYTTAAAAREHCETEERRSWAKFEHPTFDWIEDDEDGVAEMTAFVGGEEFETGYEVTALEIASKYDPEADE